MHPQIRQEGPSFRHRVDLEIVSIMSIPPSYPLLSGRHLTHAGWNMSGPVVSITWTPGWLPNRAVTTSSRREFIVERLGVIAARAYRDAWGDLAARALEPNVFLDPDFALSAAQHLDPDRRVSFLFVWSSKAKGYRDLLGVCAVAERWSALGLLASVWLPNLSSLGFPMLDRDRAGPALQELLLWVRAGLGGAPGLLFRSMPVEGPTTAILKVVAAELNLALEIIEAWKRAALRGSGRVGLTALSPKNGKELRRQRRRMSAEGKVTYATAREGIAFRQAVEEFLALEAAGWKGAAGTALLSRPERSAFTRTMTRNLADRGLCRVDSLLLDGVPVAMGLLLRAGRTDALWKIAYREDMARFSPGVQFVLDLSEVQCRSADVDITDSCAVPNHQMINRIWPDRISLVDVAIALRPGRHTNYLTAVAAERLARRLRATAKRTLQAWRAWQRANAGRVA